MPRWLHDPPCQAEKLLVDMFKKGEITSETTASQAQALSTHTSHPRLHYQKVMVGVLVISDILFLPSAVEMKLMMFQLTRKERKPLMQLWSM